MRRSQAKTLSFVMHLLFQIHLNAMVVAAVEKHESTVPTFVM